MLQILFSLIIIFISIIIIPLLFNYQYKFKFKYHNNYNINIFISTSLYSFQFERYSEDNYINNKSYINFLGLKKEFIKRKSKEELKKEKEDKKIASPKTKEKKKEKKKSSKTKKKIIKNFKENFSDFSSFINRENFKHIFGFIITLLKKLKTKEFYLFLDLCFSDPYYNGIILAYYYSIKSTFNLNNFKLQVSWEEPKFEADSEIMGEIIPFTLLLTIFKFIFSPKSIRLIFNIIKSKNKSA